MKIAFISYNTIHTKDSLQTGWHHTDHGDALIVQHSKGWAWAVGPSSTKNSRPPPSFNRRDDRHIQMVKKEIEADWSRLTHEIDALDLCIIYVGSLGSETAIELATQLPPEKVIFVLCSCSYGTKRWVIDEHSMGTSRLIDCECGGRDTMGRLVDNFLDRGVIDSKAAIEKVPTIFERISQWFTRIKKWFGLS